jgi:hypothetical protein
VPPAPAPELARADPIGDALAALPVLGTMVSRGGPGSGVFGFDPVVQDPPPVFDRAAEPVLDAAAMPPAAEVFTHAAPSPALATLRTLVEADVAALVDHVMSAFTGTKFPTQPKPGTAWWADTLAHCRKLQQQIGAAA